MASFINKLSTLILVRDVLDFLILQHFVKPPSWIVSIPFNVICHNYEYNFYRPVHVDVYKWNECANSSPTGDLEVFD